MTAPERASWLSGIRQLVSKDVGTLYVHVHGENNVEPRTIILAPEQVRRLRWLVSPLALLLALLFAVSWGLLAALATQMPAAADRIAELEADALRLDTLELRLQDLQLRYDQVTRMLGAAPATDSTAAPPP